MAEKLFIPSNISHPELTRLPESLWMPHFAGLTIAGPSGTGKTKTAEEIRTNFGIPPNRNIKIGQIFREIFGQEISGYKERNAEVDQKLEEKQIEYLLQAGKTNPVLVEGRLSGYNTSVLNDRLEKAGLDQQPIVNFLLYCDDDVRFQRIGKRDRISEEQAKQKTIEREKGDLAWWMKLYPNLNKNLYDPNAKDPEGRPYYTYAVDTTHKTVDEVIATMMRSMIKDGWATFNTKPLVKNK